MTQNRNKARLDEWQTRLLCLSGAALWLSGAAWLLLHYFGQAKGEFGPEMNPVEPWMMKVHGLALIPALLGVGGLFVAHIPKGWAHVHQRTAGIALFAFIIVLIISGYLLYYIGAESPRILIGFAHWSIGLLLPAIFVWHYVNGSRTRRRRQPNPARAKPNFSARDGRPQGRAGGPSDAEDGQGGAMTGASEGVVTAIDKTASVPL